MKGGEKGRRRRGGWRGGEGGCERAGWWRKGGLAEIMVA
jgi:hypothetical protein